MICIGYKGICRRLSGNDPRSSKPSWQCTLDRHCPGVIGVDADIAVEDACRIEHVISGQSFEAIKKYIAER